jgi:hypothetical protein
MSEEIKDKLADVYVLMYEAFKGYEDKCYMSNKLFDIMQYHALLPEDVFGKIKEFADENIRPMIFDADYWSGIEKDISNGSYDDNNHFIINSNRSLECIVFRKYEHVCGLLDKLGDFMEKEFHLGRL